jgi:drug/metabolite transporter (DMT)-like permease
MRQSLGGGVPCADANARTCSNPNFFLAVATMAAGFFSLLFGLSWRDVSLVAPAAASLTFIGNAIAAKIFLHERVNRRRWIAAGLVAAGGALLAGELDNAAGGVILKVLRLRRSSTRWPFLFPIGSQKPKSSAS